MGIPKQYSPSALQQSREIPVLKPLSSFSLEDCGVEWRKEMPETKCATTFFVQALVQGWAEHLFWSLPYKLAVNDVTQTTSEERLLLATVTASCTHYFPGLGLASGVMNM